jgi:hypothetical protein
MDAVKPRDRVARHPWLRLGSLLAAIVILSAIVSSVGEADSGSGVPTYASGLDQVPDEALDKSVVFASAWLCDDGALDQVTVAGASSLGDVASLQPSMPGAQSISDQGDPGGSVYAAVLGGSCQRRQEDRPGETQVLSEGYVVFTSEGPLFVTGWLKDDAPALSEPFGPDVDAAFARRGDSSQ